MKKLADYAEELHRCSRCGLCQGVCAIYQKTGNECASARGFVTMLEGVLSGEIALDEKVLGYLKMCDLCGKCSKTCPSAINVEDIVKAVLNNSSF